MCYTVACCTGNAALGPKATLYKRSDAGERDSPYLRKLRQASQGRPTSRGALPKRLPKGTDPVAAALKEHRQCRTALGQRYSSQVLQQQQISKADRVALGNLRAELEEQQRDFQQERQATKRQHAAELKEVKRSAEATRLEYQGMVDGMMSQVDDVEKAVETASALSQHAIAQVGIRIHKTPLTTSPISSSLPPPPTRPSSPSYHYTGRHQLSQDSFSTLTVPRPALPLLPFCVEL